MKKYHFALFILLIFSGLVADAQIGIRMGTGFGMGMGYGMRPYPRRNNNYYQRKDSTFKPSVNINLGYGFPNLDKNQFAETGQYYTGTPTYTGPVLGSIDYQFARNTAIGILITHGTTNAPYYDYSSSSSASVFTGHLNNTAIMLDLVRYMPVNNNNITPYIRTAIGLNLWDESYNDANNNKLNFSSNPSDLAYQLSIGCNFYITQHSGFFVEAGYGKSILNAGLSFRL